MRAMSRVFDAIARALGIHPSLRQEPLRRAQHQAEPASRRFYLVEWGRHIDIAPDGIGGYLATSPEVPEFASAHYFTAADGYRSNPCYDPNGHPHEPLAAPVPLELLTFCVLVLRNGFTVTGESACASPENFDPELEREIARKNAEAKIWPLMGYALRSALAELE